MSVRKVIKKNAKVSLSGRWGKAILLLLIFVGVNVVLNLLDNLVFQALGYENIRITYNVFSSPSYQFDYQLMSKMPTGAYIVSTVFSLIRLCIMAPLTLGIMNWVLELTDGHVKPLGTAFWAYDNAAFGRCIWLQITVWFKTALFSLLILLIPTLLVGFGNGFARGGQVPQGVAIAMVTVGGVLTLACIPFILWFSARYFMAQLLLCDRYYYTVREATRLSVQASRGRRWQIVGFLLSFLPWYLLCILVLPLLYVIPYVTVAGVMYSRYLFEDYLMGQKKLDLTDPDRLIVDDIAPDDYNDARVEQGLPTEPATAPQGEAPVSAPQEENFYYPRAEEAPSPEEEKEDNGIADL